MMDTKQFATELNEDDLKFYAMSDEEFDERANRLAYKALNGIVDEETIEATNRVYRNWELRFGKEEAERRIAIDKELFK
jgi:hypothetical protein